MAIFVRKDSAIAARYNANTNEALTESLSNQSLGLGDTNSTTGYHVACWYLVKQGICSTNFSSVTHFGGQQRVINAVINGNAAVGAGNLDLVDDNPELLVIAKHPIRELGLCWVAGKTLNTVETNIAAHLRVCLTQMKDQAILSKLESEVIGFGTPGTNALGLLREIMREPKPFFKAPRP